MKNIDNYSKNKKWIINLLLLLILTIYNCETTKYVTDDEKAIFTQQIEGLNVTSNSISISFETSKACNGTLYFLLNQDKDSLAISEYKQKHNLVLDKLYSGMEYKIYLNMVEYFDNYLLNSDSITIRTLEDDFSNGWIQYKLGNYNTALELFRQHSETKTLDLWTISSIGWSYLEIGDYENAEIEFLNCYYLRVEEQLNLLGLMILSQIQNKPDETISYGESLLKISPEWVFIYHDEYNTNLVRIILAESHFLNNEFEKTIEYLNYFFNNQLDINNPGTWVIEDQQYNSIEDFIISVINYLKSEY